MTMQFDKQTKQPEWNWKKVFCCGNLEERRNDVVLAVCGEKHEKSALMLRAVEVSMGPEGMTQQMRITSVIRVGFCPFCGFNLMRIPSHLHNDFDLEKDFDWVDHLFSVENLYKRIEKEKGFS